MTTKLKRKKRLRRKPMWKNDGCCSKCHRNDNNYYIFGGSHGNKCWWFHDNQQSFVNIDEIPKHSMQIRVNGHGCAMFEIPENKNKYVFCDIYNVVVFIWFLLFCEKFIQNKYMCKNLTEILHFCFFCCRCCKKWVQRPSIVNTKLFAKNKYKDCTYNAFAIYISKFKMLLARDASVEWYINLNQMWCFSNLYTQLEVQATSIYPCCFFLP